jgi:hypothetical protein
MKRTLLALRWATALCMVAALCGCMKDHITKTYTIYTPVYKERAEVLANIKSNAPQTIREKGKIFLYGPYIFLNELNKGVHVINNSNPAAPVREAFIDIPGNVDIAVKGNTLYADLYTDLLAIDITNPLQAQLKKVVRNVFPERIYSNGFRPDSNRVVVGWTTKDTTVKVEEQILFDRCVNCSFALAARSGAASPSAAAPGIAGSMSRFGIVNDYLYAVNLYSLNVLDIANPSEPNKLGTTSIGANIETIYPFKDKLFIGSSSGMFIYDITNPAAPVRQGQFMHARACDPVVADDNYAYVTLRTGSFCTGTNNQLDVVNVQNVLAPTLAKTYPMTNPHGLAKDGHLLFICDGKDGLKVFDATLPATIRQLKHVKDLETYDAIAWNNNLIVVANDGIYQYSYSSGADLKQVSKISINQ